jgi:hypothetical protein
LRAPLKVTEVFTPSVPAELGFVGRALEMKDLRKKGLNVPGTQVVVWGESGAGKSSLVNRVLEDAGRTAVKTACTPDSTYEAILAAAFAGTGAFYVAESTDKTEMTASVSSTVGSDLIGAKVSGTMSAGESGEVTRVPITVPQLSPQRLLLELGARDLSWVIEDFHKVEKPVRESIAHALKVFSDDGGKYPKTTVIVLGVSESLEELVAEPTNVGKRLIDVQVPPLAASELGKILDIGERLLNLDFSTVRARLLALACCDERDVEESSPDVVRFTENDFENAVAGYARTRSSTLQGRFRKALLVHRQRQWANTEIILRALAQLPEDGGGVGEIMGVIRRDHPTYPASNLTQYLRELQTDSRGALVRKTSSNKYRFDEPLQHAYAKSIFGLTLATQVEDKSAQPVPRFTAWELVINKQIGILSGAEFRAAIDAEIATLSEERGSRFNAEEWTLPGHDAAP